MPDYMVIATWTFGTTAAKAAAELLQKGKPALDAVIAGAQAVEDGASFHSVGYGGLPNAIPCNPSSGNDLSSRLQRL